MARQQLSDPTILRDLINLIETIIVYKLPQKSREDIAAMLNLSEIVRTPTSGISRGSDSEKVEITF